MRLNTILPLSVLILFLANCADVKTQEGVIDKKGTFEIPEKALKGTPYDFTRSLETECSAILISGVKIEKGLFKVEIVQTSEMLDLVLSCTQEIQGKIEGEALTIKNIKIKGNTLSGPNSYAGEIGEGGLFLYQKILENERIVKMLVDEEVQFEFLNGRQEVIVSTFNGHYSK